MTEPVTPAPAPTQEPAPSATVTPPWGSEENFDANRAWSLIENLRAEKAQLSARPALTPEQQKQLSEYQSLVEASKSDAQRLQDAAATAQRDAETARAEAIRYKAAATHAVPADYFDLLGSGTEDEVAARAAKISALLAAQAAAQTPPPAGTPPITRPLEQMRPGATPGEAETEDDVIMSRLFGG